MEWSRIRRAAWSVGDQAVSSLMGLGLSVAVAHAVSAHAFGAFALALATYYLALGWSRALASDVFVVRFTDRDSNGPASIHAARSSAAGTTVALGLVLCLLLCAASALLNRELRSVFVALGIALPALLLQDFMRYSFFAESRGYLAFTADVVWASLSVLAVGASLAVGLDNPALFIIEWGACAGAAATLGLVLARVVPRPRETIRWLRCHRDLAFRFFAEITIMNATSSLSIVLVGAIAGLQAAGAIRAAIVLMGPLSVILMASVLFGVAEGVTASRRSLRALRTLALQISGAFATVAVLWTALVTLLPGHVGRQILGDSWGGARQVLIAVGVYMIALGAMSGAFIGMRSLAAARHSLHARMLIAPLVLLGAAVGAAEGGAAGAAIGLAIANWVAVGIAWRSLGAAMRARRPAGERGINREVGAPDLPRPGLSPS
jgi:O-antigen/teichoic acid export membrane protein